MKMDEEQKLADGAPSALRRLRHLNSVDEVAALADKIRGPHDVRIGWSVARHDSWIAICHLRDALRGQRQNANLSELWDKAIRNTEAWVRVIL
jgi:hypothetical protein